MDHNAIYLHATISGFNDAKSLSDFYPHGKIRNYMMEETELDESSVDAYISNNLIKYGVTMLLESYEGLERVDPFFEASY